MSQKTIASDIKKSQPRGKRSYSREKGMGAMGGRVPAQDYLRYVGGDRSKRQEKKRSPIADSRMANPIGFRGIHNKRREGE